MAEKDSTTNAGQGGAAINTLEELAEKSGVDLRVLKILAADPPNLQDIIKRKLGQLYIVGELLEQRSWYDDEFCFGTESMRNLANLIMDTAQEALDYLDGKRPEPEGEQPGESP